MIDLNKILIFLVIFQLSSSLICYSCTNCQNSESEVFEITCPNSEVCATQFYGWQVHKSCKVPPASSYISNYKFCDVSFCNNATTNGNYCFVNIKQMDDELMYYEHAEEVQCYREQVCMRMVTENVDDDVLYHYSCFYEKDNCTSPVIKEQFAVYKNCKFCGSSFCNEPEKNMKNTTTRVRGGARSSKDQKDGFLTFLLAVILNFSQ